MSKPATEKIATPRKSGKQRRRERILETARTLIAHHGVNQLRVRELADAAGVATATLYNLFGGRDGIIAEALKEHYVDRVAMAGSGDIPREPAALVRALILDAARDAREVPENTAAVMWFYFGNEHNAALRAVTHDAVRDFFLAILDDIEQRGDLQEWVIADTLADDAVSSVYAVLLKWVQGHVPDEQLESRLLMVAATPFIAATTGNTHDAFAQLLRDTASATALEATGHKPLLG